MVDHLRSLIGNEVRNISVGDFYTDAANILRDCVLGKKPEGGSRPLKSFAENGMTVYDLEVISVSVLDKNIDNMLSTSRQETLQDRIELARATNRLEITTGMEEAKRAEAQAKSETQMQILELQNQEIGKKHVNMKASVANEGEITQARKLNEQAAAKFDQAVAEIRRLIEEQDLKLGQAIKDQEANREIELERALAEAQKVRMDAVQGKLVEALTAMAQTGQLQAIAQHLAPLSIVQGESLSGTLTKLLSGTPLEGMLANVAQLSLR
jgi:major vault protein